MQQQLYIVRTIMGPGKLHLSHFALSDCKRKLTTVLSTAGATTSRRTYCAGRTSSRSQTTQRRRSPRGETFALSISLTRLHVS